jgi:nucleoside-diphosphate-sugar epimerase
MSKEVLITGAAGKTGHPAVRDAIAHGLKVRAMVRSKDARSEALEKLGAEVVVGNFLEINTLRDAMQGVEAAYLCYPVVPGVIHATVNFAHGISKEACSVASGGTGRMFGFFVGERSGQTVRAYSAKP